MPLAFVDWRFAGPVDPLVEAAQACWLNANLHDDIAGRTRRTVTTHRQGTAGRRRRRYVRPVGQPASRAFDRVIEFVVSDTAGEADDANVALDMALPSLCVMGNGLGDIGNGLASTRRSLAASESPHAGRHSRVNQRGLPAPNWLPPCANRNRHCDLQVGIRLTRCTYDHPGSMKVHGARNAALIRG
jgi:hypothetical protein